MNFAVKLASSFYIIKSNGNPQYHDISRSSTASLIIRTRLSKSTSLSMLDSWSIFSSGWVDFVFCIFDLYFCIFALGVWLFALYFFLFAIIFRLDSWSISSSGWIDFGGLGTRHFLLDRCWHLGSTLDVNTYLNDICFGSCWHLGSCFGRCQHLPKEVVLW